jgi:peptidylprolyl isomerase
LRPEGDRIHTREHLRVAIVRQAYDRQVLPDALRALPCGTGPLGFYEKPEQRLPIKSVRVAADLPVSQRTDLEMSRTDTPTFTACVEARRNRREEWFKVPAGHVDVFNVSRPRNTTSK